MIASEALLIYGGSGHSQQPGLFDQVDSIFTSFFGFGFSVQLDPWRVVLDISRQDGFGPINEEEWREADGAVWRGAQAPKYGGQLFNLAAGSSLERLHQPGPDAG